MNLRRIRGAGAALTGTVAAALLMTVALQPAHAAKVPLDKGAAAEKISAVMARKEPQMAVSAPAEPVVPPNCERSRKKLWVQDQGWVVRRVTTCF